MVGLDIIVPDEILPNLPHRPIDRPAPPGCGRTQRESASSPECLPGCDESPSRISAGAGGPAQHGPRPATGGPRPIRRVDLLRAPSGATSS